MLRVLVISLLALRCFPHPVPAALCWWRLGGGMGGGFWSKFRAQTLLSTGFMLGLASGAEGGEKLGHRSLSLLFLVASLAATDSISPWGVPPSRVLAPAGCPGPWALVTSPVPFIPSNPRGASGKLLAVGLPHSVVLSLQLFQYLCNWLPI